MRVEGGGLPGARGRRLLAAGQRAPCGRRGGGRGGGRGAGRGRSRGGARQAQPEHVRVRVRALRPPLADAGEPPIDY